MQKIPYMVVVGDKEAENKTISLRLSDGTNLAAMSVDEFIKKLLRDIKERRLITTFKEVSH